MLDVKRYDIIHETFDYKNPLSVGNGDLCITVDITGLQTFFEEYSFIPLTFMSNLLWHGKRKDEEKFVKTSYNFYDKEHLYSTSKDNQEDLYNQLRMNPFKFNYCHFIFTFLGQRINKKDITRISQRLDLENGIIYSKFCLFNQTVEVQTAINEFNQQINFTVVSDLLQEGLEVTCIFSYPSPLKCGYTDSGEHFIKVTDDVIEHYVDDRKYLLYYKMNGHINNFTDKSVSFKGNDRLELSFYFDKYQPFEMSFSELWKKVEINYLNDEILDRRMVLSIYLLKINCSGTYPPQETGLTYNSWYSKFHLEMHPWHILWSIWYGVPELLAKSIPYYLSIAEDSRKRAKEQGYRGIRLPKMTDPSGYDSPSPIGPLLLWQQPHLIYMLEEWYQKTQSQDIIIKYEKIVFETIEFLESFLVYKDGYFHLDRPIISAQENHHPADTINPVFEVEYVRYAFILANKWQERLNRNNHKYDIYIDKMVMPNIYNNVYETHANTKESYTKFNQDHPITIGMYSFFISDRVSKEIVRNTLNKILETWDFNQTWGWDFPMLALCAIYLGEIELAIDILKMDKPKNTYLKNGHNMQGDREDLTIYLPGNGAFLLAYKKLLEELNKIG